MPAAPVLRTQGITTELLINDDSRSDVAEWLDALRRVGYPGRVFLALSNNIHEIRGYNRLSKFTTAHNLAHLQVRVLTSTAFPYYQPLCWTTHRVLGPVLAWSMLAMHDHDCTVLLYSCWHLRRVVHNVCSVVTIHLSRYSVKRCTLGNA